MKENIIVSKSFGFALRILKLSDHLNSKREFVISKQLIRSGTSIGANIRESQYAESRKDFIHKMSISLKEANETKYWLDLIHAGDIITEKLYWSFAKDCDEILKLLTAILNSSKQRVS